MNKNLKIISRIGAGALFLGLFVLNATVFVQKDTKSSDLSLTSLLSKAEATEETTTGGLGKICGSDSCEKQYTLFGVTTVYYGNYWHCKTIYDKTKHCEDSQCSEPCDAY